MPEGATRVVITFILTFILLLLTFPMVGRMIYIGLNDYVINTLMNQTEIDNAWNTSVQICASIYNTTFDNCAQFLSSRGLSRESYYVQNTPWFPIPMSWWDLLFNWNGLRVLIGLSLMFTLIIELGGRKP